MIRLHEPERGRLRLRGTRVTVAGRRVKVFRKRGRVRARIDLRGRAPQRVRVKVVARTTRGKVLRDTRVYRTCVPTKKKRALRPGPVPGPKLRPPAHGLRAGAHLPSWHAPRRDGTGLQRVRRHPRRRRGRLPRAVRERARPDRRRTPPRTPSARSSAATATSREAGEEPGEPGTTEGPAPVDFDLPFPVLPFPGSVSVSCTYSSSSPGACQPGEGGGVSVGAEGKLEIEPLRHHARRRGLPHADPLGDGQPGAADLRLGRDAGRLRRALELPGRGDHLLRHRPAGRRRRDRERRPLGAQPDRPAHDPGRRVGRALAGVLRRHGPRPATARCSSSSATRRAPASAPASRA